MFAQLLNEMLSATSFESFRAYALDTVARLNEARELIEDIERQRLPRAALDPVIAELNWSLTKDPVAQLHASAEIAALATLTKTSGYDVHSLYAHVSLILKNIDANYKPSLERRLVELFSVEKRRAAYRQVCGFYCSHLLNVGYSKPYLARELERHFFDTARSRVRRGALTQFFQLFQGSKKRFTVMVPVSHEFGRYLRSLEFTVKKLSEVPEHAASVLRASSRGLELQYVLERRLEAFDPYGAMTDVHEELCSLRAITFLNPEGMNCAWGEAMYVLRTGGGNGQSIQRQAPDLAQKTPRPASGRRLKSIRRYTERLIVGFDDHSTERIINSINIAALARTAGNVENQLVSLWSAVEVLLREPRKDAVRIVHYAKLLVPCIALRHVRRLFVAVYDELFISYRRRFSNLVGKVDGEQDHHTKFMAILVRAPYARLRTELCELLSTNPLALHRLWKLNSDYRSPASAFKALEGHQSRLEWQVHRIYRTRNALVHSGRVPIYLDSLVVNLGEYYRAAIDTIVRRSQMDKDYKSDIDQIVEEIGIKYRIMTHYFETRKSATEMTEHDLRVLMGL